MTTPRAFRLARLAAVARKEVIQLRRDRRSLGLAFALPLLLLVLFGYAITTDVEHVTTAIVDRDHTPESRALAAAFAGSGYFAVRHAPASDRGVLGLGILLSCNMRSQLLATQAAIFATYLPALLFSGFMFTLDNMPAFLQLVSRVVPSRYFVEATRGIFLKGTGADVLWPALLGLALYALATVALSVRAFRKELA